MNDPHERTTAAAKERLHPNSDARQSDDMGSEGGPEMVEEIDRREEAEEEVAAKLGDVA